MLYLFTIPAVHEVKNAPLLHFMHFILYLYQCTIMILSYVAFWAEKKLLINCALLLTETVLWLSLTWLKYNHVIMLH